jgi:hypothetical protein
MFCKNGIFVLFLLQWNCVMRIGFRTDQFLVNLVISSEFRNQLACQNHPFVSSVLVLVVQISCY